MKRLLIAAGAGLPGVASAHGAHAPAPEALHGLAHLGLGLPALGLALAALAVGLWIWRVRA